MADQKRWFKVWTTLLIDMDNLPDHLIGQWTRLGCRVASVGNKGTVIFDNLDHLARFLRVPAERAHCVLNTLPGVHIEEGKSDNGKISVIMKNWHTYQEDHTAYERLKRLRLKRRGEEKRGEKKRIPPTAPPLSPILFQINDEIRGALDKAPRLGATQKVRTPEFWRSEVRANPGVDFALEILRAEAYLTSHPEKHYKNLAGYLHNWLGRADREPDAK